MARRSRQSGAPKISFFAFQDIITAVTGILIFITLILSLSIGDPGGKTSAPTAEIQKLNDLKVKKATLLEKLGTTAGRSSNMSVKDIDREVQRLETQLETVETAIKAEESKKSTYESKAKGLEKNIGVTQLREELEKETLRSQEMSAKIEADIKKSQTLEADKKAYSEAVEKLKESKTTNIVLPEGASKGTVVLDLSGSATLLIDLTSGKSQSVSKDEVLALLKKQDSSEVSTFVFVRPSGVKNFTDLHNGVLRAGYRIGYDPIKEDEKLRLTLRDVPLEEPIDSKPIPDPDRNGQSDAGNGATSNTAGNENGNGVSAAPKGENGDTSGSKTPAANEDATETIPGASGDLPISENANGSEKSKDQPVIPESLPDKAIQKNRSWLIFILVALLLLGLFRFLKK